MWLLFWIRVFRNEFTSSIRLPNIPYSSDALFFNLPPDSIFIISSVIPPNIRSVYTFKLSILWSNISILAINFSSSWSTTTLLMPSFLSISDSVSLTTFSLSFLNWERLLVSFNSTFLVSSYSWMPSSFLTSALGPNSDSLNLSSVCCSPIFSALCLITNSSFSFLKSFQSCMNANLSLLIISLREDSLSFKFRSVPSIFLESLVASVVSLKSISND